LFDPTDELRALYLNRLGTANAAVGGSIRAAATLTASCSELYEELRKEVEVQRDGVQQLFAYGMVLKSGVTLPYSSLISTVPLDVLHHLLGWDVSLDVKDVHYCQIVTPNLDLEGATQVYVVDEYVEFFKVVQLDHCNYVLWSFEGLNEGVVGKYLRDFKIAQQTVVRRAMPLDVPPNLQDLEAVGIRCIGSNAQWDDAMDVSSCIRRILKTKS